MRGECQFCRHIAIFLKTSPFAVNRVGSLAAAACHGLKLPL
ncbi:hypothetical protein [Escherichia coli]